MTELPELFSSLEVENVFIYVGDAVRYDFLPDSVSHRGVTMKTVAASIHSPTSFATLATGVYPPTHGVFSFSERIPDAVPTVFDFPNHDTRFVNSVQEQSYDVDPIFSVLDQSPSNVTSPFDSLSEPFVVMERGPGGHAPYGGFDGTAWEYFETHRKQTHEEFVEDYEQTVSRDAELFAARLDELEERGELDNTLVVYTSDHGEALGEGGILGHNGPMRPELVYVPTVLIHPDLPDVESNRLFRHIDLLSTVQEVLGVTVSDQTAGQSPLGESSPKFGLSFYDSRFLPEKIPFVSGRLSYDGVWDKDGGRVFGDEHTLNRLLILGGKIIKSSKRGYLRRNLRAAIRSYWPSEWTFGEPNFSTSEARERLESVERTPSKREPIELTEEGQNHLKDLGYM